MSPALIETHNLERSVALICTDRGQHKRIRLTTLEGWWPKDGVDASPVVHTRDVGRHWGPAGDGMPQEYWCPLCRRNPQVQGDRWHELTRGILRSEVHQFDVSYLD